MDHVFDKVGRNWIQDRWDDIQRAAWFEVADAADGLGYDNAARHMRHYLGNSGDTLTVSPAEIIGDLHAGYSVLYLQYFEV